MPGTGNIEDIEIDLLLDAVLQRYGYDFRNYARESLKRRLAHRLSLSALTHLSEMIPKILHDKAFFDAVLLDFSVTVTEMFRDPHVYLAIRKKVVPVLKTYPFVKIWHAGCATGEEAYSMAILLKEEGLYDRAHIYATDYNNRSLYTAQEGIYPLDGIKTHTANYAAAGGRSCLSDYYCARYGSVKMLESLKQNITFSYHNLVTDGVFGEMNLIVCRNVLIYFDSVLKSRVLSLFCDSLYPLGFLCLGAKETLDCSDLRDRFEEVEGKAKIYQGKPGVPQSTVLGGGVVQSSAK